MSESISGAQPAESDLASVSQEMAFTTTGQRLRAGALFAARTLALTGLIGAALWARPYWLPERAPSRKPIEGPCVPLAEIVGAEDLELHLPPKPAPANRAAGWPASPRVLVSSNDRRHREREGAIWSVPLPVPGTSVDPGRPLRLPFLGRDRCSFHPHGISLTAAVSPHASTSSTITPSAIGGPMPAGAAGKANPLARGNSAASRSSTWCPKDSGSRPVSATPPSCHIPTTCWPSPTVESLRPIRRLSGER